LFNKKLKTELPCDTAIPLQRIKVRNIEENTETWKYSHAHELAELIL
jgi:hypothetical protein